MLGSKIKPCMSKFKKRRRTSVRRLAFRNRTWLIKSVVDPHNADAGQFVGSRSFGGVGVKLGVVGRRAANRGLAGIDGYLWEF